jgi:hypothetical protein
MSTIVRELDLVYRGGGRLGFTTQVGRDHGIDGVLKGPHGPHGRRVAIEAKIDGGKVPAFGSTSCIRRRSSRSANQEALTEFW